jgi:hypothetical protein
LVEPQTKVEPGLRGSQVMSCDWRRLHQVRGVCGGSLENHRVTRLSHKVEAEDRAWLLLMDKIRIPLQSTSVRTHTLFTTGFPRFLSIRGVRGLQAFDLPLHTSYSNHNYD